MEQYSASSYKGTFVGTMLRHVLGILVCIGVPALVTVIAPVSWIKFQRTDGHVGAQANTCLLFIIPFRTVVVAPVTSLGNRSVTGRTTYERRAGKRDREHRPDTEGFLVINGPEQSVEVQVTPVDLESVLEKSNAFLMEPNAPELKLFVVANWKFSVIAGGLVSLLTVIYLVGLLGAICLMILRLLGLMEKRAPTIR